MLVAQGRSVSLYLKTGQYTDAPEIKSHVPEEISGSRLPRTYLPVSDEV